MKPVCVNSDRINGVGITTSNRDYHQLITRKINFKVVVIERMRLQLRRTRAVRGGEPSADFCEIKIAY